MKYYVFVPASGSKVITTNKFIASYLVESDKGFNNRYYTNPLYYEIELVNENEIRSSSDFKKFLKRQVEKVNAEAQASEKKKEEKEQEKLQLSLMLKEL